MSGLITSGLSEPAQALGLPILVTITVSPAVDSVAIGQTVQYTATGTYADLSTKNLTGSVTWSSSKKATATVSSGGLATGAATGLATITATDPSSHIVGTAALTVTPAILVAVAVTPPVASIAVGQTEQFTATGTYSDLSTADLTNSVTWSSSSSTATVSSGGLATGVANGAVTITATDPLTPLPGTAALTVTPAVLVAVTVTPPVDALAVGQTVQLTATGTYSNLSTQNLTSSVTWSSSKSGTATVSSGGLATGVGTGAATITATDPSTSIPGTAALTVTPAVLVAIAVTPAVGSTAVGQTRQFTAMGTYSNLTTKNLTSSVTWASSNTATATISAQGLATGVANGAVVITATDSSTSIPGTAALTVTPAVLVAIVVTPPVGAIAIGKTTQFTATGTYSDLSTQDLTDSVTWSSSKNATATINADGLATGVATGAVVITATDPSTSIPGTAALTVTPAVLVAIVVTPPAGTTSIGKTTQFTATGTYSDLSTQSLTDSVTWTSSNPSTASINAQGLATGLANGAVTITATDPSTSIPGVAALVVTPAVLVAIDVSPLTDSIGLGQTVQFTATGLYSDLTTRDLTNVVTWSSSKSSVATVTAQGLAKGVKAGVATITASDPSSALPGTAVLTVGVTLSSLSMSPSSGGKKTPVTFTGTGFMPGSTATVTYLSGKKKPKRAQTVLCSATVAIDGTFSCFGVIPRRARGGAQGQKTILGTDTSGSEANTIYTLL
jgi:uncharacterized protein YjdB